MTRATKKLIASAKLNALLICILGFTCLLLSSCNIINPAEPIPAYIRVEKFDFTTDQSTQGSATNAITDVWVFVDGVVIGAFEMPATIPVLYSGTHTVTLRSGVIVNGISSTRIDYPFYVPYKVTADLEPGVVDTLKPSTTYGSVTFSQREDFDQSGLTLEPSPQSADTEVHRINTPNIILEGFCGAALLDASHQTFEFISIDSFPAPTGSIKYMELDYKCDNEFTIGLQSYTQSSAYKDDLLILKPTGTWTKIYVSLNTSLELYPSATRFKIYLRGVLSNGKSSAAIYFDNIKVIRNG